MFKDKLLTMNLQMFAADDGGDGGTPSGAKDDPKNDPEDNQKKSKEPEPKDKKYTDDDVDDIVNKKFAKFQKELEEKEKEKEEAIEEAERLAKMNADEKKEYELEKLRKENEEYKRKNAYNELSKEASKMLSEHEIQADDDLLQFVVKDDAEGTQSAVNALVEVINAKAQQLTKEALTGKTPKFNDNTKGAKNPFSKEHFNLTEQGKLKQENPALYKQLKAQAEK